MTTIAASAVAFWLIVVPGTLLGALLGFKLLELTINTAEQISRTKEK